MNRRTWLVVIVLLVVVSSMTVGRSRTPKPVVTILPPTGQEPIPAIQLMIPAQPMSIPTTPAIAPSASVVRESPAPAPAASPAAPRVKRFWGNRGYVVQESQSTFVSPSELDALKRNYLRAD